MIVIVPLRVALGFATTILMSSLAIEARAQDASPWQRDGHSAVRLLAGSRSGAVLLGGIAFQLQPGWKTYWRSPGDSGVPPRFDFSKSENIEAVTVLWPAPVKFDDGWIETTRPLILGGLPKDSKEQKIVNVTPNALNLQGWNSIDFKVSFDRLGRRFSTGWMFILLPDKRFLEVVYSAPDEKFTQVRAAATEMLKGWELHVVIGKTPAH